MGYYRDRLIRELKKTALSPRTHESYIRENCRFFNEHPILNPNGITQDHVTDWLLLLKEKQYAPSSINMAKCALQFFFKTVIPRPEWTIFSEFKAGKKNDRRPSLSVREAWKLLNNIKTPHNRTALVLIYLCGLRISECVNLQVGDIHRDEKLIHIHRGKGAKSRYIPLPQKALTLLGNHWLSHRNPTLMFPSLGRGMNPSQIKLTSTPMPLSSIQSVFKKSAQEVNINKRRLSVHSLRHSYATHLLELGVPVEHLKFLMGHTSITTTEAYLHITKSGFLETQQKIETLAEPCCEA